MCGGHYSQGNRGGKGRVCLSPQLQGKRCAVLEPILRIGIKRLVRTCCELCRHPVRGVKRMHLSIMKIVTTYNSYPQVNLLAVSEVRERVKKLPIPTEAFTGQNSHFSAPSIGYHSRTTSLQPHHYQNTPAVPPSLPQKALPAPSSLPTVTSQKPVILPPNISSTANSSTSNAPSHSQL